MSAADHSRRYLEAASAIASAIDPECVDAMAEGSQPSATAADVSFVVGVGGGAGHASHAVNDFRKLCLIESYTPTDNVSELTARTNDDGWETSYSDWLRCPSSARTTRSSSSPSAAARVSTTSR